VIVAKNNTMAERINIYEMYVQNGCRLGFYVRRDNWKPEHYAKVIGIEFVQNGEMIKGNPPYFGGFVYPPDHRRAGKKMGPRLVTLQADWFDGGDTATIETGGNYCWSQIFPNQKYLTSTSEAMGTKSSDSIKS
jgi:hypothetical protein